MRWEPFTTFSGIAGWRAGDGRRLAVVVHGGPGLGDYTEPLAEEVLAADPAGLTVARYQQRGQAPSTVDGPLTVEQAVADFVEVVRTLGFTTAVVVGHSWGGHLSFHIATDAPDVVEAMFVVDPLGAVGDGGAADLNRLIVERMAAETRAALVEVTQRPDATDAEKARAELRAIWPSYFADPATCPPPPDIDYDKAVLGQYLGDAVGMLTDGTLAAKLAKVRVPAHFLLGAESPIPPVHGEATAAIIGGATTTTVAAGHFMWLEQAGCATDGMRALLNRLV